MIGGIKIGGKKPSELTAEQREQIEKRNPLLYLFGVSDPVFMTAPTVRGGVRRYCAKNILAQQRKESETC